MKHSIPRSTEGNKTVVTSTGDSGARQNLLLGLPQFLPALSPHHTQYAPKAALRLSANILQEPNPSLLICPPDLKGYEEGL